MIAEAAEEVVQIGPSVAEGVEAVEVRHSSAAEEVECTAESRPGFSTPEERHGWEEPAVPIGAERQFSTEAVAEEQKTAVLVAGLEEPFESSAAWADCEPVRAEAGKCWPIERMPHGRRRCRRSCR